MEANYFSSPKYLSFALFLLECYKAIAECLLLKDLTCLQPNDNSRHIIYMLPNIENFIILKMSYLSLHRNKRSTDFLIYFEL